MSTLPVTTVIERAEATLQDGRYREAMRLCQALLREFPKYLAAHRLLGRAALHAGEIGLAEEAFQAVRQLDPEDREAALGLSQIAEQRGELETALAFCQAVWECSPWDRELRERVARLAEACYGEGQLFLTGAALAAQHSRGGRWSRAANECRAVLSQTAERVDVQQRLAVALWRRGELDTAAQVCQSVLQALPDAVVPLLILAQIEQERGETHEAAALRERACRIDVDGRRAATLALAGEEDLRASLLPAAIPQVDEAVLASEAVPAEAGAPGLAAREVRAPAEERDEVLLELPSDEELEAARPAETGTAGYTSLLRSLEGEGLEPFSPAEGADDALTASVEEPLLQLPSDDEIEAARPRGELEPGWTGLLESYELEGLEPFTPEVFAAGETVEAGAEPQQAGVGDVVEAEAVAAEESVGPASEAAEAVGGVEDTGSWLEHAVIDQELVPGVGQVEPPAFEEWYAEERAPQAFEEVGEPAPAPGRGATDEIVPEQWVPVSGEQPDEREALSAAAERLGIGPELFERSRAVKEELVATGRLGQHPEEGEPVPEAVARGEGEPEDRLVEARRLFQAGRIEEAMSCYRALYRAGRAFDDALIAELTPIADAGGPGAAEADRLLGAIYRRRGTQALAARHYERSLRRK